MAVDSRGPITACAELISAVSVNVMNVFIDWAVTNFYSQLDYAADCLKSFYAEVVDMLGLTN